MSNDVLINILVALVSFLVGNKLAIGRDKRKEFNEATEDIRNLIRAELEDVHSNFATPRIYNHFSHTHQFIPFRYKIGFSIASKKYKKACKSSYELQKGGDFLFVGNKCTNKFLLKLLSGYVRRK